MPSTRQLLVIAAVCVLATFAIAQWTDPLTQTTTCSIGAAGGPPGGCSNHWPGRPWFVLEVFLGGLLTISVGWLLMRAATRVASFGRGVTETRDTP